MKKKLIFLLIFFLVASGAALFFVEKKHVTYFKKKPSEIKLGKEFFSLEIADNKEKAERGLSGRNDLCEKCAMLFLFNDKTGRTFWMKEMNFDIDIIWISNNKIVQISPRNSHILGEKETRSSDFEVDKVVEINAGLSEKLGLEIGDEIILK